MTKGVDEVILPLGWAGGCSTRGLSKRQQAATALDHHRRRFRATQQADLNEGCCPTMWVLLCARDPGRLLRVCCWLVVHLASKVCILCSVS